MSGVAGKSGIYTRTSEMKTGKYKRTSEMNTGKYVRTSETKENIRKARTGTKASQETKDSMSEARIENWKDINYRKEQIKSAKEKWNNPVYRDSQIKAIMEGSDKSPNECEKLIFKIVDKLFPNEWLLNTKGEHIRPAGKSPDIVNLKDKKIIEHYGDRWHGNTEYWKVTGTILVDGLSLEEIHTRDKKRIKLLESLGWKVLIIWEHELKDTVMLITKISDFYYA